MSSNKRSKVHQPELEPDAHRRSKEPRTETQSPTGTRKDEPGEGAKEDEHTSGKDTTVPASPQAPPEPAGDPDADSDADSACWSPQSERSPEPASGPCSCRCGGCCCHGGSSEPRHCVRCHTDYTFNHSQACTVPHVFSFTDLEDYDEYPRDAVVRSVCCGHDVQGPESLKGEWQQPTPCFMGWHTTDVEAVDKQYNGLNVLRCDPGPEGRCRRARMKHHAHYKHLYDSDVKYTKTDSEDQRSYLKRKRDEMGDGTFDHVDEEQVMSARERRKERGY